MTVSGLRPFARPPARAVAALGMFDGVHVGHQRLIRAAVREARRRRGTSVVVTFHPDPQRVLMPSRAPEPLMPLPRRVAHIRALGADIVWIIPFTRRFSTTIPDAFIRRVLLDSLEVHGVVVGTSFAFGHGRRGRLATLQAAGARHGFDVVAVPPVVRDGAVVSSSRIRALVREGRVPEAGRLLGRPFELAGTVVHGAGRASRLGFPTANVRLEAQLLPPRGVYSVELAWRGHTRRGLMNLGIRPTFGGLRQTCEVHVPKFRGRLYGAAVTIRVRRWLRPERRFASPEALIAQIRHDLAGAGPFLRAPAAPR